MRAAAAAFRGIVLLIWLGSATGSSAADPLRVEIDRLMPPLPGFEAPLCSDAEFLRRVSLDLAGMPPTGDESRAFLEEASADKRERLVDRLLNSWQFERHFATTIDLWLMERRPHPHISQDDWQRWLLGSVRSRKPWNVLARELLLADGSQPESRPAARFFLDRDSEPHLIARDLGRILFGRDLQCAQCHDHPLVTDFLQADYHGLLAFVAPGYAVDRPEGNKKLRVHGEKSGSDLQFESVFLKGTLHRTGARLPDELAVAEPLFLPGEEYEVAPADGVAAVPRFSRRRQLAELATSGANRPFNENISNRLWAHMMGRGLVHPLDMHHPENPPIEPELLRRLGESIAAMDFDIRAFLRELALSATYQRPFDRPANPLLAAAPSGDQLLSLSEHRSALEVQARQSQAAYQERFEAYTQAEAALLPIATELDTARQTYAEVRKKFDEATAALRAAQDLLTRKQEAAALLQPAAEAARLAAEKLPEDTELAAAAQKFAERAASVAAELPAMQKAVDEKTAALTAPTEALAAARPAVETALVKTAPLQEALRQAESLLLPARRQAQDDDMALQALRRRETLLQRQADLARMHQSLLAAQQTVAVQTSDHDTAQQQLRLMSAELAAAEHALPRHEAALAAQEPAFRAAEAERDRRQAAADAVESARTAVLAATEKLPEDQLLGDVAALLQSRVRGLQEHLKQSAATVEALRPGWEAARREAEAARQSLQALQAERDRRAQAAAAAEQALLAARAELASLESQSGVLTEEMTTVWSEMFQLAGLKPLTPEQMCWSIFQVTGVYGRYWAAEAAELDKSSPLTPEQLQDPQQQATRARDIEQRTFDKLKGNLGSFVPLYGGGAGQPQGDFFAAADQALFALNGGSINSWVAPSGGNVTERIITAADPQRAAQELYLAVLTRWPTEEEVALVTQHLADRPMDRAGAAQELVWGLLNSSEFRFNH
jgi:hypothetical protein